MQLEFDFKTYVISVHVNEAILEYTVSNPEQLGAIDEKMHAEGFQFSHEVRKDTQWLCMWVWKHQVSDFDKEFPVLRDKLVEIVKEYGGLLREGHPRYDRSRIKAGPLTDCVNSRVNWDYLNDECRSPSWEWIRIGEKVSDICKNQIDKYQYVSDNRQMVDPFAVGRIQTSGYRVSLYVLRGVNIPALSNRLSQEEGFKATYNVSGVVGYASNCPIPYCGTHDVRESGKSIVEVRERLKAILTELGLCLRPNDYFEDYIDLYLE